MPAARDRLSQMIARLSTQRACLSFARSVLENVPGVVLEIGLGKGRTFDYLRSLFPDREIYAFDRSVHCPDDVRPDPEHLILGEFRTTLRQQGSRMGRVAALAHADIGSSDADRDAALCRDVAPLIGALVRNGGMVICDREMPAPAWEIIPRPTGAGDWPYFIYRLS